MSMMPLPSTILVAGPEGGCTCADIIDEICRLNWATLDRDDLVAAACAYYYFSIQFRESLEIARALAPTDPLLARLWREECATDNLSPWPGVAACGERLDHDEFVRRLLELTPLEPARRRELDAIGCAYLVRVRRLDPAVRAAGIASYEDGGLERVFRAMLGARDWDGPALAAFHHFLVEHVRFDSDPAQGHGALSRHLAADERAVPLWLDLKRMFVAAVPQLEGVPVPV